jgi:transcription antitermination factor NusG
MAYWAVARTPVRREGFAAKRLEAGGFEAFAPRTPTGALFPGYLFIRIGDTWRAIDRTVGVLSLVKFGDAPARCPEAEVESLMDRVDPDGIIRLAPAPQPAPRKPIPIGAKVRTPSGLSGIYLGMTAREREKVLIDLLGRQKPVTLRAGQSVELLELVPPSRRR